MTLALQLRGVVKRYGRLRALDGLDLDVPTGCCLGLVGANGAGKTTLISVSAGFLRPQAGQVNVLGLGPFDARRHAGRVGVLPQDARPPPHARVGELLHFYGALQGLRGASLASAVATALERAHLSDRRQTPAAALSHGMQRRFSVAQALLGEPELVLLDEPLAGLDPREAVRMRGLLVDLRRDGGMTLVISSHQLPDIEMLCDEVAFVDRGRRVRQDALRNVTGRDSILEITLESTAGLPWEDLRRAFPAPDYTLSETAGGLRLESHGAAAGEADLNARLLPLLLAANARIREIRAGDPLEQAYLRQVGH
ncbi:MAG: ABC transporter ATP-binding protein [Candidatus Marinimicrobia bacterium]|nr:ABC transporter ATP-binding protein [Candidatus Neomarinimicrobiota bacterium]